ncbi:MAG: enoyl-CoA hydratase-related protein [Myxococcota bacterium]|nr:enoyl-CoA hydratase-related protein [Myxococcota bacterium]
MDETIGTGTVSYAVDERVAIVTLNRPQYRNAQSRVLREELDVGFKRALDDPEVRVIVLAGEGDHFSSGHDIGTPEERQDAKARPYPDGNYGELIKSWEENVDNTLRWRDLPKPTIAAVQGYCIFGGWMIAAAMDLIVAADDARFLPTLLQYFSVPWDLQNFRKAKEQLWLNEFVSAERAFELGFVNRVVPRERLMDETLALAKRIARSDPLTARLVKKTVNEAQDMMGFRTSISTAHSSYTIMQLAGVGRREDSDGRHQMSAVQQAVKRERKTRD